MRPECGGAPAAVVAAPMIRASPTPQAKPQPAAKAYPQPVLVERCDPARPHTPHPTDCYKFYHCVDRLNGVEQVEKFCNPPTMFHPVTMICDWPASVALVRPECGGAPPAVAAPVLSVHVRETPQTPSAAAAKPLKATADNEDDWEMVPVQRSALTTPKSAAAPWSASAECSEALGECACHALGILAQECRNQDAQVDLSGWRSKHDCIVDCPGGTVYNECNRRACEVTCANRKDADACPEVPDLCVPGCVCPDGLVRKGDRCVKANECRDCICDAFGDVHYFSFDRNNFTFGGNCSYVAARDKLGDGKDAKSGHDFQASGLLLRSG